MKNKILPLSLVTLVIFLGALLISATVTFPESFLSDPDNEVGVADKSLMSTHLNKIRANQNTHVVDNVDVLKAHIQAKENAHDAYMEDFDWGFLGPNNVGGFTKAILFDKNDETAKTIIAGAMSGGLYKSINTGLTWSKINGVENNLNITSIAQAADGTIYVGTGGLFMGSGIYKSTDGENFILLPSTDPTASGGIPAFALTNRLAVNQDNGTIFASTALGIWYSSDQGATWNIARADTAFLTGFSCDINIGSNGITAASMDGLCYISESGHPNNFVLHSNDTFNLPYENVGSLELAISPSNPDILYATPLRAVTEEMINLYRSDDKGVHWRIVAPGNSPTLNMVFTDAHNVLEVFPNNPDRIIVGGAEMWEGLKLSETGYFQWVQKSLGTLPGLIFPSYVHTWHYTYVFRPGSDVELFVGSNGGISRGTIYSQYYEFAELNTTYTTSQAIKVGIGGVPKLVLGGYDQNGVQGIYADGNPAQALNGHQIWLNDAGLPIPPYGGNGAEVFLSIIDPLVAIYSQQGGDFRRSEDLGANASTTFLGSGMTFPNDYIAPAMYWENFENENSRDTVGFKINTTIPVGTELWIPSSNRGFPFKYTTETTLYPGDSLLVKDIVSTKLFIGAENTLWMTTAILDFAGEPEWFQISNSADAGLDGLVSSMGMSADANFVFVGTEEGLLYKIANISLAYDYERADVRSPFCIISTSMVPVIDPATQEQNTQIITSVSIDPQDANNVVITMGNYGNTNYIYRSTNALDANPTFTSIQGSLPATPMYSSLIEMNNSNLCIIGTEMGMFATQNLNNATPTWDPSYGVIGQTPVFDLKQQIVGQPEVNIWLWDGMDSTLLTWQGTRNFGYIYAATYGRGLYYSNKYQKPVGIITPDMQELQANIKVYPNPVSNNATIEYTIDEKSDIIITVFDINGRLIINDQLSQTEGTHQYKFDCSSLPRGMYVVSIQAGNFVETSKFIVAH